MILATNKILRFHKVYTSFEIHRPSKLVKSGHYRPASETLSAFRRWADSDPDGMLVGGGAQWGGTPL